MVPNGGAISALLTPSYWLLNVEIFNSDGTYTNRSFRRTESGLEIVAEKTTDEDFFYGVGSGILVDRMFHAAYSGEVTFYNELIREQRGDSPLFYLPICKRRAGVGGKCGL